MDVDREVGGKQREARQVNILYWIIKRLVYKRGQRVGFLEIDEVNRICLRSGEGEG